MKYKSNKLLKLEKNRFSVFYEDLSICCNCGSMYNMTKHEIFEGRNRVNSIKYGFVIPLCLRCHQNLQENLYFNKYWKVKAQTYFENNYGTFDDFMSVFRMNYKD